LLSWLDTLFRKPSPNLLDLVLLRIFAGVKTVGVLDGIVDLHPPLENASADRLHTCEVARVRL
jgi:hypothetical protein